MIVLKPDTAALAERLATASGETVEQAVHTAVEQRARVGHLSQPGRVL